MKQRDANTEMIYLDNAATTPVDPAVIEVIAESMRQDFANSGAVYRIGLDARKCIERAAEKIADALGVPSTHRLVFTSGGSESNNLFIKGICFPDKKAAYLGLEHPSVVDTLKYLAEFGNEPFNLLEYQKEGRLDLQSAIPVLKKNRVRLLCLSHVNNELGTVNDPESVVAAIKSDSPQTRIFLDGVQAVGKLALSPGTWPGLAGYSISGHKINGPKGIGLLIYDSRLALNPQIHGGRQQFGVRSGTLPAPLILGLAKAVQLAVERVDETQAHLRKLHSHLIEGLRELSERSPNFNLRFNSLPVDDVMRQSPSMVNFSFPPVEGEVLLHHLEEQDIYVGLGSACSAHSKEPSKILTGLGLTVEEARCSLRISFGRQNTLQEVDRFLDAFGKAHDALYPTFSNKNAAGK
ncbi:MAG: class V aminotransferase [Nitrospinaceae bacterium]|nr:MAG: class V aminotransferase [Nitrospinaceae bacterium]